MSPAKRSALMSRIKGRDTAIEVAVAVGLRRLRRKWESHPSDLPGRPDFVHRGYCIAIFVDGDFWHGWRFNKWRHKLSEKWEAKIQATIRRDERNFRRLRARGWTVIRLWEHQVISDLSKCIERVAGAFPAADVRSRK